MKTIIKELKNFIGMYSAWHWMILLGFCAVSVFINYGLGMQNYINSLSGFSEFIAFFSLYAIHSLFAFALYSFTSGNYKFWTKYGFYLLLIAGFSMFAFRAVTWQHRGIIDAFSNEGHYAINRIVYGDIFRLMYLVIPVFIIWFFKDRSEMPLYGVSGKNHNATVYWILLACMIPLIAGASMLSDFLDYYPRASNLVKLGAESTDILLYELFYGLDFFSIELFFRGFMVIAFIRYAGIHAVLPMAAFYLSIHYGKPLGEAISSFFGGTILGVISFYSRSIYGGIMVHVGIAWLMELGAFIGNLIKDNTQ